MYDQNPFTIGRFPLSLPFMFSYSPGMHFIHYEKAGTKLEISFTSRYQELDVYMIADNKPSFPTRDNASFDHNFSSRIPYETKITFPQEMKHDSEDKTVAVKFWVTPTLDYIKSIVVLHE